MQFTQSFQSSSINRVTSTFKQFIITIENIKIQTNAENKSSYVQKVNKQRNQRYQTRENAYHAQNYQTKYQLIYQQLNYQFINIFIYHVNSIFYVEQYYSTFYQKTVIYFDMNYIDSINNLIVLKSFIYYVESSSETYYAEKNYSNDIDSAINVIIEIFMI